MTQTAEQAPSQEGEQPSQQEIQRLHAGLVSVIGENQEFNRQVALSWLFDATVAMPRFGPEDNRFRVIVSSSNPEEAMLPPTRRENNLQDEKTTYEFRLYHGTEPGIGKDAEKDINGSNFQWESMIGITRENSSQGMKWGMYGQQKENQAMGTLSPKDAVRLATQMTRRIIMLP